MSTVPLSINTESLEFNRSITKQPLYRPAALRRNHSSNSVQLRSTSPSLSPAPSIVDLKNSSWSGIAAALPWSPVTFNEPRIEDVRGNALDRNDWMPDQNAVDCFEVDCSIKFGVRNRKHHCRKCGQVYCAQHSSRSTLLWPTPGEASRPSTPSRVDIPALVLASYFSTTTTSSAPSSPRQASASPPAAITARVCDQCYFSVPFQASPIPLITPPHSTANSIYSTSKPLALRSRNSTPLVSPVQSPGPGNGELYTFRGKRSRHGSVNSTGSISSSSCETPPTSFSSVEGLSSVNINGVNRSRAVSPAASLRAQLTLVEGVEEEEENSDDDTLEEERFELAEAKERELERLEREKEFGSVIGEGWSSWATF